MKKISFIMLLLAFATTHMSAQNKVISLTGTNGRVVDTVTNTGTINMVTPIMTAYGDNHSIQVTFANVSGTSTLRAILQSSIDGVNWVNHFGTVGQAPTVRYADTLAVTSTVPASWIWSIPSMPVQLTAATAGGVNGGGGRRTYYRVRVTGTATQVTTVKAQILPGKL